MSTRSEQPRLKEQPAHLAIGIDRVAPLERLLRSREPWVALVDEFPSVGMVDGPLGKRTVPRETLAEFESTYDGYHLDNTAYFSDAAFGADGRRWHTDELDLALLGPGFRTIVLTHPDHWNRSMSARLGTIREQDLVPPHRR